LLRPINIAIATAMTKLVSNNFLPVNPIMEFSPQYPIGYLPARFRFEFV
jgi:hypothetical protein